jgi:vault protein inter-alpha-trypsin-like protein
MRCLVPGFLVVVGCHSGSPSLRDPAPGEPAVVLGYRSPPPGRDLTTTGLGGIGIQLASTVRKGDRDQLDRAPPPVSLTPTDGTELAIRQLAADIRIHGPLAHTELHVTFHNAEPRIREGRFTIAMPPGAAVSRFAMKIGDAWREARIVSRTRGREVYETYLHRRVDPALLERDADNRFSARVFPIPGGADKEIIIGYDHVVGPSVPYVLALRGLPAVPVAITIDQDGASRQRASRDAPADLVLAAAPGDAAVGSDAAFVARIEPVAGAKPAALDRVLLLVDTSASRASIMGRQAEAVRRVLDGLPAGAEVVVAVFDHTVEELYRGRAGDARGVAEAMLDHGALGASKLAAALGYAATAGMARVVLIGDAVATLSEREPARLAAIVIGSAIERVDVIQLGQALDADAARAITGAARSPGAILDGRDLGRVAHQLARALPPEQPIAVAGAAWTWPATTRGVAPGDPIFVYGVYDAGAPRALAVTIGGRAVEVTLRPGDPIGVGRAVASAELAALGEALAATTDPEEGTRLRADIERVALAHGLVSSQTSLLTLETDADEQRMLGPRPGPPEASPAPLGDPSLAGTPNLTDEELAKLAAQESRSEVIVVTGSLIGRREVGMPSPISIVDRASLGGEGLRGGAPDDGSSPWSTISPQRPSIILYRDRTPYARPEGAPDAIAAAVPLEAPAQRPYGMPYVGALRDVMAAIARQDADAAVALAIRARADAPEDVAAIIALGEALEAHGDSALAARAYGSLIDLFPNRDELVRAAGERFDRIGGPARELAVDAYRRALDERPDRAVSYRRLGYALVRLERWTAAIDVLVDGLSRISRPSVTRIVREDIGLVAAAAIAAEPARATVVRARLASLGIALPVTPSLRFVLGWETDANDVDLHVRDRHGDEAYYGRRALPSGGQLLDDITDGFGPEMLSIEAPDAFPYRLAAHYYQRGPEGVGLGAIQIIRHDGHGGLTIEDRPFALQVSDGMIDVGIVAR